LHCFASTIWGVFLGGKSTITNQSLSWFNRQCSNIARDMGMKHQSNNRVFQPSLSSQTSHALRIPLTGIMGMTHLLSQTNLTKEQQDSISIIQSCAEQLLAASEQVCDLLQKNNL